MARTKRLLGLDALEKGGKLLALGVPMIRIHKELGLYGKWSAQSTREVLHADRNDLYCATRPPWLTDLPQLQETPACWAFKGTFPYGEWVKVASSTSSATQGGADA